MMNIPIDDQDSLNAVPTLYFAGRLVGLRLRVVLAHAAPVLFAGEVMAAAVVGIDTWAAGRFGWFERLALDVASGVLIYWLTLQLLRVRAYRDVVGILRAPAPVVNRAEGRAS